MKQIKRRSLPYEISNRMDNLIADTNNGAEDSPAGRLVLAYNADKITSEHFPALRAETKNAINILDDADEYDEYPSFRKERKQLASLLIKLAK